MHRTSTPDKAAIAQRVIGEWPAEKDWPDDLSLMVRRVLEHVRRANR